MLSVSVPRTSTNGGMMFDGDFDERRHPFAFKPSIVQGASRMAASSKAV